MDRNKGAALFDRMTAGRDPALLKLLTIWRSIRCVRWRNGRTLAARGILL